MKYKNPRTKSLSILNKRVMKFVLCFIFSAALIGCDTSMSSKTKSPSSSLTPSMITNEAKPRITSEEMDAAGMRLNLFGVSYYEVGRVRYPIISYILPEKADYVQIMRCRSDVRLGDLGNIEIGASNTQVADEKYKKTDYWKAISTGYGCVIISAGVSIDKFVDFFASSGSWLYLGRACIEAVRLPVGGSEATVSPCSRQISKTSELTGFINKEISISSEKKAEIVAQRDRIDSLGRNLIYQAKQLDTEISRCEKEHTSNAASQKRRAALGNLLSVGVGLGAKMLNTPFVDSATTGLDVKGIFTSLFADASDFLPSDYCPAATRLASELDVHRQQIETETESYNQSLKLLEPQKQ